MSREPGSSAVNCSSPVDAGILADYWLALLTGSDEEAVEEHLLRCDVCGQRLREIMSLAEGIRSLAQEGALRMIVTDTFLQRAAAEGLRIRQYEVSPGKSVECTVTAEDDILIGRLAADLHGAGRVDLSFCNESGVEQIRLEDIPVHSGAASIAYQESTRFLKAAPTSKLIARLVAVEDNGSETLLGEYTFNHTRSLPGPGDW
jgi:hypothetical protein